jgi:hypothetical protein
MIFSGKNKNKKLAGLLLGILTCIYAACIDDKGNYSYREINSVEISGIEKSYSVPMGQPLKITPTLSFSISETQDSFKYEWYLLVHDGNYKFTKGLLSSERNLDIIIGSPIPGDGLYNIIYCVTNKTTGIRYDHIFELKIIDRMQSGYIMLCERENDSFDIDLISIFNDTLTQYHNVLDLYNSQIPRTGRKPLDVVCYGDPVSPTLAVDGKKKYAIWILTDKGTERVRIENFEWQPEFNISGISTISDKYLQGEKLIAEKMYAPVVNSGITAANWVYCRGNWYWYNWMGTTYFYISPINASSSVGNPYKAAPYIVARAQNAALLFNEDANRFEYQNANSNENSTNVLRTNRLSSDNTYFNWENPNYRLIYMDNKDFGAGFAIVKNVSSDKYELLLMDIPDKSVRKLGRAEFPAGLALENVKFFAFHNSMPYLYCATEDKLYRINTTAMQQWDDITSSVLPAGHKISRVKNTAFRFPVSGRIIVATYDPNGQAGKNGLLALYDVQDGTGNLTVARHPGAQTVNNEMKWTGFGKIINIDYKDPK